MTNLSHRELSNRLYEISIRGYEITKEADGAWGYNYAIVDGKVVIASGPTIEDAVEEFDPRGWEGKL